MGARRDQVTPFGTIEAFRLPGRGLFLGNRGQLTVGGALVREWQVRRWITCALEFKGWRAPAWGTDRRWTPLFFTDEAVALAAGHRPCALCRRPAYDRWCEAWGKRVGADETDRELHASRLDAGGAGGQRRHERSWSTLPPGAFVLLDDGRPALVHADRVRPWSTAGYGAAIERPARGDVVVLTPARTVDVLAAGYAVEVASG